MPPQKPSSFMNWLGRQVGHVKGAVKTQVPAPPKVVYRNETVQEAKLPDRPNEILRRTTIDEVVIPPAATPAPPTPVPPAPPHEPPQHPPHQKPD